MAKTRGGHHSATKTTIFTNQYTEIQAKLLERLTLIAGALNAKENSDVDFNREYKMNRMDESEKKIFTSIQKYHDVHRAHAETDVAPNFSSSRNIFLNSDIEKFFASLKIFLQGTSDMVNVMKVDKRLIIGAIFNTEQTVAQCMQELSPILMMIQNEDLFELNLLQKLPKKTAEVDVKIASLNSRKNEIESKLDSILSKIKTSELVKDKIKKWIFESKDSQTKCWSLLTNIKHCTRVFKLFREILEMLNTAGFYNVNSKPVVFWSGGEGQKKADTMIGGLSDSNVPAVSIFSYLGIILKNMGKRSLSDAVFMFISAEFAKQATRNIKIVSSTSSKNERTTTFTINNFHWEVELQILLILKDDGIVNDLQVYFFDQDTNTWSTKPAILFVDVMNFAPRRLSDPALSPDENRTRRQYAEKEGPPRPYVLLGRDLSGSFEKGSSTEDYSPRSSGSFLDESPSINSSDDLGSAPRTPRTPKSPVSTYRAISRSLKNTSPRHQTEYKVPPSIHILPSETTLIYYNVPDQPDLNHVNVSPIVQVNSLDDKTNESVSTPAKGKLKKISLLSSRKVSPSKDGDQTDNTAHGLDRAKRSSCVLL